MSTFTSIGLHPILQQRLAAAAAATTTNNNNDPNNNKLSEKKQSHSSSSSSSSTEDDDPNTNNNNHSNHNNNSNNNNNTMMTFPPIYTPQALLTRDAQHISNFLSLSLPLVYQLRSSVAHAILEKTTTTTTQNAWEALEQHHLQSLQDLSSSSGIKTGSRVLDDCFLWRSGSSSSNNIIQVTGPSPSGKTQLALSMTAAHCLEGDDVVVQYWTSTCTSPIPLARRLQSILLCHANNNNTTTTMMNDDILQQIQFQSIQDGYHLYTCIQSLFQQLKNNNTTHNNQTTKTKTMNRRLLLIIDSASACLSSSHHHHHSPTSTKHSDIIYDNCIALRKLVYTYPNVKIFITNGTVQSGEKPALHNTSWKPADQYFTMKFLPSSNQQQQQQQQQHQRIIQVTPQYSLHHHNDDNTKSVMIGLDSSGIVDIHHN